jgi:hypothetical protein
VAIDDRRTGAGFPAEAGPIPAPALRRPVYLLAKMEGVFGRWSWVANGVLHGCYHVHQPWGIVGSVISCVCLYAFPTWRFRSTWMGVIVHSAQSVFFALLILGIVLGLA